MTSQDLRGNGLPMTASLLWIYGGGWGGDENEVWCKNGFSLTTELLNLAPTHYSHRWPCHGHRSPRGRRHSQTLATPRTDASTRDLPVTHGSVGGLDDECLLLAFSAQLLDVVLELGVLGGEDPGFGTEAVLLRLALYHSAHKEGDHRCGTSGDTS